MSLQTSLSNIIERFLFYLCTLLMSSISSILEIINISFVLGNLDHFAIDEEIQINESLVRVYLSSCIVIICSRIFRNICYLTETRKTNYWFVISMNIWIISCLFHLGTGIAVFIVHGVSLILIAIKILIWILIFIMSHLIDLAVIGIKNPKMKEQLTETQECFICMEEYTNSVQLDCGHDVHQECLEKWALQGQQNCPLCRSEIV
jgi:Ring finger domain